MAASSVERVVEPGGREPAPSPLRVIQLFVNSLNIEDGIELFDEPGVVNRWFVDKELADSPVVHNRAHLDRVVAARAALRALLVSNHDGIEPQADAVEVVESLGSAAELGVTVAADGRVRLTAGAAGLDAALGRLLAIVVESSLSGTWRRLKACSSDSCRWAFWDGSRNRSSRWCSMELCGNQAKVRAHRRRNSATR